MDMESWRSDKYSNGRYKVRRDFSIERNKCQIVIIIISAWKFQFQWRRHPERLLHDRKKQGDGGKCQQSIPEWTL